MKRLILMVFFLILSSLGMAFAAEKTVVLAVPGMVCSVCPITVRLALEKVPGVIKAKVSLENKEAVVMFDDAKTNPKALEDATFAAGYPSTLKSPQNPAAAGGAKQ
jgi:mercuric ion binding protein